MLILSLLLAACDQPPGIFVPPTPVGSPTPFQPQTTRADVLPSSTPPAATETPMGQSGACIPRYGSIDVNTIFSEPLNTDLTVRVYLPPCYDPANQYPVLYLLHGQGSTDELWDELGANEVADVLIREGRVKPFIIVMPREDYYYQDPQESAFEAALVETLLPWVDAQYATCAEPTCRAIGGISRGAYWALHLAFNRPDLFSAVGGHSLPDTPFSITRIRLLTEAIPPDQPLRVWVDIGDADGYYNGAMRFHNLLDEVDYPHEWVIGTGGHDSLYWSSMVEQYLNWYGQGF